MKISLRAYAKINLSIEIIGKRKDGYHDLSMIMQSIEIYDKITIERNQTKKINLETNKPFGRVEENLAYKAAKLFFEVMELDQGCNIYLEKNIPSEAGLAGGSTDAAAILLGLNHLIGNPLTDQQLLVMASKLGADVPFCLFGGTMKAEGIGNILTPLPFVAMNLLIVKPEQNISTRDLFETLEQADYSSGESTQKLAQAIQNGCSNLAPLMINKMYPKSLVFAPDMENIIHSLEKDFECQRAMMSGSGSTIFAIFEEERMLDLAYNNFKNKYKDVYKTKTSDRSIRYEE